MRPRRVLICNDFAYVDGGASQVALQSAIHLARHGVRVTLFSAVGPIAPELSKGDIEVVCLNQPEIMNDPNRLRGAVKGIWNSRAAEEMRSLLMRLDRRSTVVHIHSWTKALTSSIFPVINRLGFRSVLTLHDYFSACPNGAFYDYPASAICHRRPLSMSCVLRSCDARSYAHKAWRVARQITQRAAGGLPSAFHHFVYHSAFCRDRLAPHLPGDGVYHPVGIPIDTSREPPVAVRQNDLFLQIGRLSPEKGPLLFAEAARELGLPAAFIGDGPQRDAVASTCSGARITGWLPRSDVHRWLRKARALVLPSGCYETFGLAVAEAASRGVPSVVSDACAARDFIDNGVNGLLFRSGDTADLREKLSSLRDGEFAARLGSAAYERYWSRPLTIERHVAELVQVYEKILGPSST